METRELGFWMCTALVIGNMIGMGIFMQPAALAPFGLNALTGWVAVIAGCGCLAIVFAALARRLPQAAGPFGYVRATLGEPVAFAQLWCYWISVWVTNAALAVAIVGYFVTVFPIAQKVSTATLSIAFMWIFVGINLLGVKSGGRVQVITSLLKLVPLILVIVVGAVSILSGPSAFTPNLPTTPIDLSASTSAATIALFAMLGFESAAVAAGRVKDPERTVPRATLIGTLFVATIYVTVVLIGMLVVPQATLAAADAPFVAILDSLLGVGTGRWLALFVVISGLGCLNGWTLLSGELTRTLALHNLLPEIVGRSNRFGAPWLGLILAGGLATLAFIGVTSFSSSLVDGFTKLTLVVAAANLPLYACCVLAFFWVWRRDPGAHSPFMWVAGLGGMGFSIFAFIGAGRDAVLWTVALALAGLPLYFWMRRRRPDRAALATPKM